MKRTSGVATFLRIIAVLFMVLGIGFMALVGVPYLVQMSNLFGFDVFEYMGPYAVIVAAVAALFILVSIMATGAALLGLAKLISLRQAASAFEQYSHQPAQSPRPAYPPQPPQPVYPAYPPQPTAAPYYNQPAPPVSFDTAPLPYVPGEPIVFPTKSDETAWVCSDCGMSNIIAAKFCVGCGHGKP